MSAEARTLVTDRNVLLLHSKDVSVGNGVEPTPHSLKKCQHCHVILLHQKIERTRMYDHEDEKVVFEEEYKLNKTIPACGVSFILLLRLHKNLAVTFWRPCQDMSMWGFIRLYTFAKDVYMC